MAFDEDDKDLEDFKKKKNLKNISSQKSIFDGNPKKPSQQDFENKVKESNEKAIGYKAKAAELSLKFKKIMSDKTLFQNKNVFSSEMEAELLTDMVKLAVDVNTDPNEQEGMGSLMWVILLLKMSLMQRDRINNLEYLLFQLEKKVDSSTLSDEINQKIKQALDKHKNNE